MFGVVVVQIVSKAPTVKSETMRQQLVNQLSADGHPLKPVIMQCLDKRKNCRPMANKVCAWLQVACESLAADSKDTDSIANKLQQLCLDTPSVKNGKRVVR